MAKYIELEAAIQAAQEPTIYDLTDVPEWLSSLPTANVVPAVHGRYIPDQRYQSVGNCGLCGAIVTMLYNYCPECGARMDGDDK